MNLRKALNRTAGVAILASASLALFQNCSYPRANSLGPVSAGGTGADGLRYITYGTCQNNQTGIAGTVYVSLNGQKAIQTRKNCEDLAAPQALSVGDLKFAANDSTVFQFNGQVFDQQISNGGQRVTMQFCQGPAVQSFIWSNVGNLNQLFGSVTLTDGSSSGTLLVDNPTANPPTEYKSSAGQTSMFDLLLSGSLTYSIGGGSSVTISGLHCATQSQPPVPDDGSQNAPAGPAQHPTLLSSYVTRGSWKVAGVDYAVGFPTGIVLKDFLTDPALTANPNIVINSSNKTITISGDNVTLDGYDFTLHGGYDVYVSGNNATITNCRAQLVQGNAGISNMTVTYCVFDGRGANGSYRLVGYNGLGTLTLKYNWFKHFSARVVEDNNGGNLVYKYNLIEDGGYQVGMAYLQLGGGTYNSLVVEFNTTYQPIAHEPDQGFEMFWADGSVTGDIAYNSMIALANGNQKTMSYMMQVGGGKAFPTVVSAQIHDNFIDASGAWGAFYPGTNNDGKCSATYSNNFDMTNGIALTTDP